jgi:hypothetical protein
VLRIADELTPELFIRDQPSDQPFDDSLRQGDRLSVAAIGKFRTGLADVPVTPTSPQGIEASAGSWRDARPTQSDPGGPRVRL